MTAGAKDVDLGMDQVKADLAVLKAGQEMFHQFTSRMETAHANLARRIDMVAEEMRANTDRTTRELHDAALSLRELAMSMQMEQKEFTAIRDSISKLETEVRADRLEIGAELAGVRKDLETLRTKGIETAAERGIFQRFIWPAVMAVAGGVAGLFGGHISWKP